MTSWQMIVANRGAKAWPFIKSSSPSEKNFRKPQRDDREEQYKQQSEGTLRIRFTLQIPFKVFLYFQ